MDFDTICLLRDTTCGLVSYSMDQNVA